MARRHGVLLSAATEPRWRLGVWQVFDPWVDPHLQALQGYTVPAITRPLTIEFHFRRVVQRLVRSLARLYQRVREWDQFLEAGGLASAHPELAFEIPEEGGIAADSVFHYLSLFIDDLARVVPLILASDETEAKEPDGFATLKRMLNDGEVSASPSLRELFAELDSDDSWWFQGFKRGAGIRQRLTHYTDLVYFRGSTKPGDPRISGDVSLISVGGPIHVADFEGGLQELFSKLCEWLDRLDPTLLRHLSEKLAAKGVSWNPIADECPTVALPRQEGVPVDASHYLYLPVSHRDA
ncbi:MAG: hypothetical protein ACE5M4_14070 [Anaerolineales bacterium]